MEFDHFRLLVPKLANPALPGENSHLKMEPPERRDLMQAIDPETFNPRRAAVLMLIYPGSDGASVALIRRNSYKGVHSSQIAFPGGKIETDDPSPLHAALRETEEEIGIDRGQVEFISALSPVYIPPSNFCVSPFLAFCMYRPVFIPDPREVSQIIELPLRVLLDDQTIQTRRMPTSYSESIDVPCFEFQGNDVWGATAMMLSELKDVLNNP